MTFLYFAKDMTIYDLEIVLKQACLSLLWTVNIYHLLYWYLFDDYFQSSPIHGFTCVFIYLFQKFDCWNFWLRKDPKVKLLPEKFRIVVWLFSLAFQGYESSVTLLYWFQLFKMLICSMNYTSPLLYWKLEGHDFFSHVYWSLYIKNV